MKKKHAKIIQDALDNLEKIEDNHNTYIGVLMGKLEEEKAKIEALQLEMQGEYDELSENKQEGEEGQELQSNVDTLGEAMDEYGTLKDDLDADIFDEVVDKLKEIDLPV